MGIDSIVPANISKYTGKSTTCKIKLIGKTDVERDTFPFAIPVKARYQSVQGVTISMIKPIHTEGQSDKTTEHKRKANQGGIALFSFESVQLTFFRGEVFILTFYSI